MFLTHLNQAFLYRMQGYDTGYIKDAGYIKQDTEYRIQDTGYKIQVTRYSYTINDTEYRINDTIRNK